MLLPLQDDLKRSDVLSVLGSTPYTCGLIVSGLVALFHTSRIAQNRLNVNKIVKSTIEPYELRTRNLRISRHVKRRCGGTEPSSSSLGKTFYVKVRFSVQGARAFRG